jgi:hypothetical protein
LVNSGRRNRPRTDLISLLRPFLSCREAISSPFASKPDMWHADAAQLLETGAAVAIILLGASLARR